MLDSGQDQATGLRRLFAREMLQVLSVRGSRATPVTLDLAGALVALGHRPLILDLDQDQAAITLGFQPRFELADVLAGDVALSDALLIDENDVAVLPAMHGFEQARSSGSWRRTLTDLLRAARQPFNVWLINGGAGRVEDAESPLVVIEPTRDAITGAYAHIKSLARIHGQREFRIVVDRAASESAARSVYASIAETSRRFLSARLDYCGYLPRDERTVAPRNAAARRNASSQSPRAHAFSRLAAAVIAAMPGNPMQSALNTRP